MKKLKIFIFILIIALLTLNCTRVYATASLDDIMGGASNFISVGESGSNIGFSAEGVKNTSDLIYNILLVIGIVVAIGVAIFLGIKFMTSSVEEQAKVKESLIVFVVGCVVIFGAFGIWKLVTSLLENL